MARYFKFDQSLYDQDGLISLFRGDDWSLYGKVNDYDGTYVKEVDLSDIQGVTGYFPAASGGTVPALVDVKVAEAGNLRLSLAAAQSAGVALSNGVPFGIYLTVQRQVAVQKIAATNIDSGSYRLEYNGVKTLPISLDGPAALQEALRGIPGLESVTVTQDANAFNYHVTFAGVEGPVPLLVVTDNTAQGDSGPIVFTITHETTGAILTQTVRSTDDVVNVLDPSFPTG